MLSSGCSDGSSTLIVATDGECLTCGGFSVGQTIHFGSLEFIVDCFGGLRLSPKGSNSDAVFGGITHGGSLSLRAMIEDSTEEFYFTSSGEGGFGLPFSRRHGTEAPPTPITMTPWLEDIPATQAMRKVQPWVLAPRSDTGLPLE
jgi:hypothetical protein